MCNQVLYTHITLECFNFKGRMNYKMRYVFIYFYCFFSSDNCCQVTAGGSDDAYPAEPFV